MGHLVTLLDFEQVLTPKLRPHQNEAVDALAGANEHFAYAEMSVASGKSLTMAALAQRALASTRVLLLAHTEELASQNAAACRWLGLNPLICSAGLGQSSVFGRLTVGTVGTVANRLEYFKDCGVVIVDEVHRAKMRRHDNGDASQYLQIKETLGNSWFRGLTGTGWREDGTGSLENTFGKCVFKYSFLDALEDGFVKPLRAVAAKAPDIETKGLKTNSQGEWSGHELTNRGVALAPEHAAAFIAAMEEEGRSRALVFACDIKHADALEAECKKLGFDARAVHTGNGGRGENVEAFRRGAFPILVSVQMFNTGFDIPDIDFMAFCRPMKSSLLYAQSLGRGARLSMFANDCVVVDFGGNILRHGALDMIKPPKQRGASAPKTTDGADEKAILDSIERTVGGDLRKGAAEGELLSRNAKPRWVKPVGDPTFLIGRRLWLVPTTLGQVRWFSPSYPLDAQHLYCVYDNRKGWTAYGAVDKLGALHKAA
jgi:DNA repair protein RadD